MTSSQQMDGGDSDDDDDGDGDGESGDESSFMQNAHRQGGAPAPKKRKRVDDSDTVNGGGASAAAAAEPRGIGWWPTRSSSATAGMHLRTGPGRSEFSGEHQNASPSVEVVAGNRFFKVSSIPFY